MFFSLPISGQNENYLVHPLLYDTYLDYHLLPDSGIRIFIASDQSNGWTSKNLVYHDFYLEQALDAESPVEIYIPNEYFYHSVDKAYVLKFKNGDILWANDVFDCDFGASGGVLLLNNNGNI